MDRKKMNKEDFKKEHELAVKAVQAANSYFYPGYISISKARNLIQLQYINEKEKAKESQDKLKEAVKRGFVNKKDVPST
jgi:hypothetical protein